MLLRQLVFFLVLFFAHSAFSNGPAQPEQRAENPAGVVIAGHDSFVQPEFNGFPSSFQNHFPCVTPLFESEKEDEVNFVKRQTQYICINHIFLGHDAVNLTPAPVSGKSSHVNPRDPQPLLRVFRI